MEDRVNKKRKNENENDENTNNQFGWDFRATTPNLKKVQQNIKYTEELRKQDDDAQNNWDKQFKGLKTISKQSTDDLKNWKTPGKKSFPINYYQTTIKPIENQLDHFNYFNKGNERALNENRELYERYKAFVATFNFNSKDFFDNLIKVEIAKDNVPSIKMGKIDSINQDRVDQIRNDEIAYNQSTNPSLGGGLRSNKRHTHRKRRTYKKRRTHRRRTHRRSHRKRM